MIDRANSANFLAYGLFADVPAQLPWLHHDESLYSWCAAAHRLNTRRTAVRTSRLLFGAPYSALAHDIPERLVQLQRSTGDVLPEPMELVRRHSILGFYLPFLTRERVGPSFGMRWKVSQSTSSFTWVFPQAGSAHFTRSRRAQGVWSPMSPTRLCVLARFPPESRDVGMP